MHYKLTIRIINLHEGKATYGRREKIVFIGWICVSIQGIFCIYQ